MRRLLENRWFAVMALAPFPIMVWLHHYLGLSDALNIPTPPGEREAHLFNWIMVATALCGGGIFLLRACLLLRQGERWFLVRILGLLCFLTAVARWG